MKIRIILFFLVISSWLALHADPLITWQLVFGAFEDEEISSIVERQDGGYLAVGKQSNQSLLEYDILLMALDSIGEMEWMMTIGGEEDDQAWDVAETVEGDFIVVGYGISDTVQVQSDGISSLYFLEDYAPSGSDGEENFWMIKITSTGEILWINTLGGDDDEILYTILPYENDFFIGGYSRSDTSLVGENKGAKDAFLMRMDSDGNSIWQATYGGSGNDVFYDLAFDSTNQELVAVGASSSADGDVANSNDGADYWVTRIQPDTGELLWERTYGGFALDFAEAVIALPNGDIVVTGNINSGDGDIDTPTQSAIFPEDAWVVRLDADGEIVWQQRYGLAKIDQVTRLIQSQNGDLILTYNNFDPTSASENSYSFDIVVSRLEVETGLPIWSASFGGSAYDICQHIIETRNGDLVVAGYSDSIDGDVGGIGKESSTQRHGADNIWIFSLFDPDFSVGISPIANLFQVKLSPNPTPDFLSCQISEQNPSPSNTPFSLKVYDIQGSLVYEKEACLATHTINTQDWNAGIYLVAFQTKQGVVRKKVLKN